MKRKISLLVLLTMMLSILAFGAMAHADDEEYEIAVVVKVVGIDYFSVFEEGVKEFAEEYGVNAYVTGPSTADAAEQVNIIEDLINSGVDAICVVPNDATVLESVLQKAQDQGIVVVTTESPDQVGADYDVELIINDAFAELVAEDAAAACKRRRTGRNRIWQNSDFPAGPISA